MLISEINFKMLLGKFIYSKMIFYPKTVKIYSWALPHFCLIAILILDKITTHSL